MEIDINTLQKNLIAAAISENNYRSVGFLTAKDFDYPFSEVWVSDERQRILIAATNDIAIHCAPLVAIHHPKKLALALLEYRFRKYFDKVMDWMKVNEKDPTNVLIIEKTHKEAADIDVMVLVDTVPEYLSQFTNVNKLKDWSNYVNKRIQEVKGYES